MAAMTAQEKLDKLRAALAPVVAEIRAGAETDAAWCAVADAYDDSAPAEPPKAGCSHYAPAWEVAADKCSKDFGHRDEHVSTSGRVWINRRAAGQTGWNPWR